jgi:hypothetical protein
MKALWTMMIVALAAGLSACASTTAATKPTLEDLAAQVDDLQRQNAELRQQVGKRPAPRQVDPAEGDAVSEPLPTNGRALIQPEDMVPPPAKMRRGPPQNWAWMHTQPAGCASGVYALTVVNQTDYYINLMIDGEPLRVRGARGLLPGVPPHEKVYMCLGNLGKHTFTGELFALRYGQAMKVGTYRYEGDYGGNTMSFGTQEVIIRDFWVTWTSR